MALAMADLITRAREELSKLTGLEISSVLGATKTEEGWNISIEMVEKYSIPDQMDILAVYNTLLDDDGNLLQFNRRKLRKRVDTEEEVEV